MASIFFFFLGVQIGFQPHPNHSVETKLSCPAARWGRRTWSSAALVEEGRVGCLVQRVSHCFAALLRCCVERDVPRQRDCFQATQEGIVVFRSPLDQILKSCLFEVPLVQFMVRGNNVSVDGFFWPTHFFFVPCDSLSINVFDGVGPVLAQMHQMFFHYII